MTTLSLLNEPPFLCITLATLHVLAFPTAAFPSLEFVSGVALMLLLEIVGRTRVTEVDGHDSLVLGILFV
jgi:hypothetical protein